MFIPLPMVVFCFSAAVKACSMSESQGWSGSLSEAISTWGSGTGGVPACRHAVPGVVVIFGKDEALSRWGVIFYCSFKKCTSGIVAFQNAFLYQCGQHLDVASLYCWIYCLNAAILLSTSNTISVIFLVQSFFKPQFQCNR